MMSRFGETAGREPFVDMDFAARAKGNAGSPSHFSWVAPVSSCRRHWWRLRHTWPLRVRVVGEASASFVYDPERMCVVTAVAEIIARAKPAAVTAMELELKGLRQSKPAVEYVSVAEDGPVDVVPSAKREVHFLFDSFVDHSRGRIIVKANGHECRTAWFRIRVEGRELSPCDEKCVAALRATRKRDF
ncbi:MAG: hypothetical protein NTU41_03550 [Chloroflexi bacterium]|nr:hypothetical protein [Chloroflexota bacterium]